MQLTISSSLIVNLFWVQYLYIFGEHYIKGANRWWRTKRQTI